VKQETSMEQIASRVDLTLKMEPICFSEMSAHFQRITRRYILEDRILHRPILDSNRKSLRMVVNILKTKLRGFSPQANYTDPSDRSLPAKLVPTLADRGCRVVSAT
jgi:hypothetical protein